MDGANAKLDLGRRLADRLYPISLAVGLIVSLVLPVTYCTLRLYDVRHDAVQIATQLAERFQTLILDDQTLWKYQTYKFQRFWDEALAPEEVIAVRVQDETGRAIAFYARASGAAEKWWNRYPPTGHAPIVFNGRSLGRVEISLPRGEMVAVTLALLAFSTALGVGLAVVIYRFPTRIVMGMEGRIEGLLGALHNANRELERKATEAERLVGEIRQAYDDLKGTRDQLIQARKMEAVGLLAGGVAHDFNNLLTVIIGRLQLLRVNIRAGDPLRERFELIEQAAFRAAGLTRQLLAFSRKQVLELREVDLATVIGDITPMLRRLIGEQIELILRPGPDPAPVMADAGQLEQVLMNLVINARDAMPAGGRLSIETAGVDLDAVFAAKHPGAQIGPHAMLAVGDTGEGIKPEILDKIFDPFFTTKDVGKGTGLGLSTVHGIVQQHHGCIGVQSEVGRGTTFRVYLPRLDRAAQSPGREAQPETATRGAETILLTEDEPEVRRVAREVLELSGYTVLEAHGVDDALRIVDQRAAPIDLLLSDVIMPRLNGPELADQVRRKYPHMRVLYMSGYADNSVARVLASDALFLQKPFTPAGLERKVREALELTPP